MASIECGKLAGDHLAHRTEQASCLLGGDRRTGAARPQCTPLVPCGFAQPLTHVAGFRMYVPASSTHFSKVSGRCPPASRYVHWATAPTVYEASMPVDGLCPRSRNRSFAGSPACGMVWVHSCAMVLIAHANASTSSEWGAGRAAARANVHSFSHYNQDGVVQCLNWPGPGFRSKKIF